jgi:uncharacterized protein (TIGR02246 family)
VSDESDKQQIRNVIEAWIAATAAGDLNTVLGLMAEDVVFLLPGRPPMRGRESFAVASRSMEGKFRIEGRPDIQEIQIAGNFAFCWNYLSITVTPLEGGGGPQHRAGNILSVFRKEPDGRWVLFRDANLLASQ